jgi:hypothetical protein
VRKISGEEMRECIRFGFRATFLVLVLKRFGRFFALCCGAIAFYKSQIITSVGAIKKYSDRQLM